MSKVKPHHEEHAKYPRALYEKELLRLQAELVELKEWVRVKGQRLVVIFEGRDAAGKGGVIKRVSEYLNPRWCRVAALPAPTDRERSEWYFQRYVAHLLGARLSCSTAAGTTGRAWSASWAFARK